MEFVCKVLGLLGRFIFGDRDGEQASLDRSVETAAVGGRATGLGDAFWRLQEVLKAGVSDGAHLGQPELPGATGPVTVSCRR